MLRGLLAEFGIVLPKGVGHAVRFARQGCDEASTALPEQAHGVISDLRDAVVSLHERVASYSRQIATLAKDDPNIARLQTIPGVGPITASAIAATIGSARQFRSGRDLAAWLGLTPLNRSSGGKERVSKMGDRYIRRLLVVGMTSRIKQIRQRPDAYDPWFSAILERKPAKLAGAAMVNKTARIVWAVLSRGEPYRLRAA